VFVERVQIESEQQINTEETWREIMTRKQSVQEYFYREMLKKTLSSNT